MFRFRTNPEFRAPRTAGGSSTFGYLLAAGVGLVVALFVLMAFSASRGGADELTCPDTLPPDALPSLYCLPPNTLDPETIALYPEGIAADESGVFYVSSVADGSIYLGNVSSINVELFLPGGEDGRASATGLKLDNGRLFVAGAGTGMVFVYDASSGDLIRSFDAQGAGFLNDLAITETGDAYITDSFQPVIWRVPAEEVNNSPTPGKLEPWLDLTDTPIKYTAGVFNLNGIVATPDGRFLLTVQSNTGKLYRINIEDKEVSKVNVAGPKLTNGDGLVLTGNTLYVIRNQGFVTKISLDENFESGRVEGNTPVPSPEDFPTTAALVGGRLLVVNSQFAEGGPGQVLVPPEDPEPEIPFTVSAIPAP
jgi:sugar lactone lactonase YvrE